MVASKEKGVIPCQKGLDLFWGDPGTAFGAQAVDLALLLQTEKTGVGAVVSKAELLPPVHPVPLFPQRFVVGSVKVQAGHPVGSVGPRIGVVGEQQAQPFGKHQILPGVDLVLILMAERDRGRVSHHSRSCRNRSFRCSRSCCNRSSPRSWSCHSRSCRRWRWKHRRCWLHHRCRCCNR